MDPSMFFLPVGPGWPRLIGPVGAELAGFPNPPLDPSRQLRLDLRRTSRDRDLHRQIAVSKALKKMKMMGQKAKAARPLSTHQEITTVEPLKVGGEHGKLASPRDLEHRDAFDALEYSSPPYLLEKGNNSSRTLPGPHTRGEQFQAVNEELVLEDTFMAPLEPTFAN